MPGKLCWTDTVGRSRPSRQPLGNFRAMNKRLPLCLFATAVAIAQQIPWTVGRAPG